MRAKVRHSPVRIEPGWNCWPKENCPLSPAGEWGPRFAGPPALGADDGAPPLGLALGLAVAALAFGIWARTRD